MSFSQVERAINRLEKSRADWELESARTSKLLLKNVPSIKDLYEKPEWVALIDQVCSIMEKACIGLRAVADGMQQLGRDEE